MMTRQPLGGGVGVKGGEQGVPLVLHLAHHGGVHRWGIHWAEGHDLKCIFFPVGAKEGEFLLIQVADTDLMVALACIKTDKPQSAEAVAKVVDGVITVGDGVFECEGHTV